MPFYRPPNKKPTSEQVARFWTDWSEGKRRRTGRKSQKPWFDQSGFRKRVPVKVTPTLLGTVRTFENRKYLRQHLRYVTAVNKFFRKAKFRYFEFQPTQIFSVDRKNLRTLERVYPAPNAFSIKSAGEGSLLYGKWLSRRLRKKNVPFQAFLGILGEALTEFRRTAFDAASDVAPRNRLYGIDVSDSNILVLDYDPVQKKVLLSFVDHGLSHYIR